MSDEIQTLCVNYTDNQIPLAIYRSGITSYISFKIYYVCQTINDGGTIAYRSTFTRSCVRALIE